MEQTTAPRGLIQLLVVTNPKLALIVNWVFLTVPTAVKTYIPHLPFMSVVQFLGILIGIWGSIEFALYHRKKRSLLDEEIQERKEIINELHKEETKTKKKKK